MLEGGLLAFGGGLFGCGISLALDYYVRVRGIFFGTMDFQSFSETIFQFRVSPDLVAQGLVFSVLIGLVGSFLPALRAARLPVIAALKSV
jgi:putative ABC transport system permease protein